MVVGDVTVGMPLMTPVRVSIESPAGNTGVMEYLLTVPVTVGVSGVIAVSLV